MPKKPEVQSKLYQIHYQRNKFAWVFHLILIVVSTYFQRERILTHECGWLAFPSLALGLILRALLLHVYYGSWKAQRGWALLANYTSLGLIAAAWVLHFAAIFFTFGPDSYNASHTLLLIACLVSGAAMTSAAHQASFHILSVALYVPLILLYLFSPDTADNSISLFILINYGFNAYINSLGNKELCRSIENEVAAHAEKERINRIIDTVPGFVSVFDKNLKCLLANKAMLQFYPDIVGKTVGDLEKNSHWEQFLSDFLKSDKATKVEEAESFVGGEHRWILRNCRRSGEDGAVFVSLDITELVKARNMLREQEAKAQYSAKLASLGEMAAGIAHEINNPLTIIQGSASVLEKLVHSDPIDKGTVSLLTGKIIQTSSRISKTVRSLKSLSRNADNDPFEEVSLESLIEQCLEISRSRCVRHGVKLITPEYTEKITFKAREVQISQVLVNLISNAIDAVKNSPDRWIKISYLKGPGGLDLLVSDSGSGVPEEIRNKIMEPFFTTKEVNQGTGLGLSISKNIMRAHNGELSLLEGTPTTFRVHLPATL